MSQEEDLIYRFNGITFTTRSSPELLKSLATFNAREDDVLLVSYPKSGKVLSETWVEGFLVTNVLCSVKLT